MEQLGFPLLIRFAHFFNILFLSLLARSGVEILGGHPMLYWNDACTPGSEWLRFTRKKMPRGEFWTAEDEKEPYHPWVALPGRDNLGIGRYWHFTALIGWILVGLLYLAVLIFTPEWRRLIPTSWSVFPGAVDAAKSYLSFHIPETEAVFNPLQQLAYASVILLLAPLQILTGIAMAPAVAGRFPWYPRIFGGRQAARSLHFIGLVAFGAFTVHHTAIVVAHGFGDELAKIVLGITHATPAEATRAIWVGLVGVAVILAIHIWATRFSLRSPQRVQQLLQHVVDPPRRMIFGRLRSRQYFRPDQVTADPRPNGRAPRNEEYLALLGRSFVDWHFTVGGLVEEPLAFTLPELRALAPATQITEHCCIQGWSYIAEWEGVRLTEFLQRCRPRPEARYLLFETFDEKWEEEGHGLGNFYSVLDLEQASHPQTILAYGMNGKPLATEYGAPLRLRVEDQLGFQMAKHVSRITLIDDYRDIGDGNGNWRADHLYYSDYAPI